MPPVSFTQIGGPLGALFAENGTSHTATIPTQTLIVTTSGQPGFDMKTGNLVTSSTREEIEACFDCVEAALRSAGVEDGLAAVYKMTSFLLDIRLESEMMDVWRKRMPEHRPAWVTVGVAALAVPGMHIEMMAEAAIPV